MFKWIRKLIYKLGRNVKAEVSNIIEICVGLLVAGVILPISLVYVCNTTAYGASTNPAVVVVATVLLPILAVIGIAMLYMKYVRG